MNKRSKERLVSHFLQYWPCRAKLAKLESMDKRSLVRPTGLEPVACRLGICRSIHLSYERIQKIDGIMITQINVSGYKKRRKPFLTSAFKNHVLIYQTIPDLRPLDLRPLELYQGQLARSQFFFALAHAQAYRLYIQFLSVAHQLTDALS